MNPLSTTGRIHFHHGRATLHAPPSPLQGMLTARVSLVSPGTERRHLTHTVRGRGHDAGYMNLAGVADGWALAPCPHGAAFSPSMPGTITAAPLPAPLIAAARFQLMAARGLERVPQPVLRDPVVIGTGPVAAGAVLELFRRGAERVRVWTRRPGTVLSHLPGVTSSTTPCRSQMVVDAVGDPGRALEAARPGAVVGMLGTPEPGRETEALAVHRAGVNLVGMHELAGITPGEATYQETYDRCAAWLATWEHRDVVRTWCRTLPGVQAPKFYTGLLKGHRPAEPFVLWDWGES